MESCGGAHSAAERSYPTPEVRARSQEDPMTEGWRHDCDPMDYSLPGSSVHGIFQAIVLEWVAIFFSRGSSQTRD